ncbi:MAG: hypothetical protein IJD16_00785 [Desulfovibrio sp.]|nr:hypothetical protein [Desulfovibrio sp.]
MNITTEQMEALLLRQSQQAGGLPRQSGQSGSFEALLARQMNDEADASAVSGAFLTPGTAQSGLISQMLLQSSEQSRAADADTQVLQAAFDQASGTLELWDDYARALSSSGQETSLRDAYAMLEGIESQVSRLRQDTDSLRGRNPGFDSLLNELEVMTVTEKFKFNRGDYYA